MLREFRRANGNNATFSGLGNDGDGNMMPMLLGTLLEWNDQLKYDATAHNHRGMYTKFAAVDVLANYRSDLNKIRGGLGTPEEKKQW